MTMHFITEFNAVMFLGSRIREPIRGLSLLVLSLSNSQWLVKKLKVPFQLSPFCTPEIKSRISFNALQHCYMLRSLSYHFSWAHSAHLKSSQVFLLMHYNNVQVSLSSLKMGSNLVRTIFNLRSLRFWN